MWQLFVVVREGDAYGNAVHSQTLSFECESSANMAYDKLVEYISNKYRSKIHEVVKLY